MEETADGGGMDTEIRDQKVLREREETLKTLLQINAKNKKSNSGLIRAYEHIPELEQAPMSINTWVIVFESTKIAIFTIILVI